MEDQDNDDDEHDEDHAYYNDEYHNDEHTGDPDGDHDVEHLKEYALPFWSMIVIMRIVMIMSTSDKRIMMITTITSENLIRGL